MADSKSGVVVPYGGRPVLFSCHELTVSVNAGSARITTKEAGSVVVALESKLRTRREEEELSRPALARRAGCATSTIQLIEEGWVGFSPKTGQRIAGALGMTLDQLVS
jgi:DNA-binding XRE family transcriptional regulator